LNNKTNIFLFGGNSKIGSSIVKGVVDRVGIKNTSITSFIRTEKNTDVPGEIIKVGAYKEGLNYIEKLGTKKEGNNIFILSFGVLRSDKENKYLENFKYHIDINSIQPIEIYEYLISNIKFSEIHIVSSILSDFIRPSLTSYSLSKYLLTHSIKKSTDSNKNLSKKIYTWKISFVKSDLNKERESILLKTNPETIRKKIKNVSSGGVYYIPSYSKIFSKTAHYLTPIVKFLDKKY